MFSWRALSPMRVWPCSSAPATSTTICGRATSSGGSACATPRRSSSCLRQTCPNESGRGSCCSRRRSRPGASRFRRSTRDPNSSHRNECRNKGASPLVNPPYQIFYQESAMPSFDITSEVNKVIRNRFDFKGSDARIEQADETLVVYADDDFKLKQVMDVFTGKCARRSVDVRSLAPRAIEKIGGNKVKQLIDVK